MTHYRSVGFDCLVIWETQVKNGEATSMISDFLGERSTSAQHPRPNADEDIVLAIGNGGQTNSIRTTFYSR